MHTERRRISDVSAAAVLSEVDLTVRSALHHAGVAWETVKAAVAGTPGVVDPTGRVTLAPQLGGWEGLNLGKQLGNLFPCSVVVENEVRLSMLAERWRGRAQNIDDLLYLQLGVGVGAALLVGGEVYRGAEGAAGEIGYLPVFFGQRRANVWGSPGIFESAVGGAAYASAGRELAKTPEGSLLKELADGNPEDVDATIVFEAVRQGHRRARQIVNKLVGRLAYGVMAAVVLLDPSAVVIGGGLSRAGELLLDPLERRLQLLMAHPPKLILSSLGDESAGLGAIRMAADIAGEQLFEFASPTHVNYAAAVD